MRHHDVPPLDPAIDRMLAAERRRPGLDGAICAEVADRLAVSLGSLPGPSLRPRGRLGFGAGGFVLGMVVGGALVAARQHHSSAPVPPARLVPPAISSPASPAPLRPRSPEPSAALPPPPSEVPTAEPAARSHVTVRASAPSRFGPAERRENEHDRQLAAERELLDAARSALARGQGQAAAEAAARHARLFPAGRLAEERDTIWINALVQQGRLDEARARAADFRRSHPSSMLLPAIDAVLAEP